MSSSGPDPFEQKLRKELHDVADSIEPADDGLEKIQDRTAACPQTPHIHRPYGREPYMVASVRAYMASFRMAFAIGLIVGLVAGILIGASIW